MPQFTYKAKIGPEQIETGVMQADNQTVVIRKLKAGGLHPISIEELNPAPPKKANQKIRQTDLSAFTRQLANLTHSGFPLAKALSTLSLQSQNPPLKKIIEGLQEKIQKGATFSDALGSFPDTFSFFYINMVKIGEASGKVDETLGRLADFKEKETELTSQVKSALAYPAFLLSMGAITIFIMITFFIPMMTTMFLDLEQRLPLPTQIIISISNIMNKSWWLFLLALAALAVSAKSYYKTEPHRLRVDSLLLAIPLVKNTILKVEIARFSYALAVLLKSAVPVVGALEVVTLCVDNRLLREKISSFQNKIKQGQSLSSCLKADKIFPPIFTNMVAVGEESGELNEMLVRIASAFETEVNRNLKTIVSLIEPILILAIGGIVVLIATAILLPVFQINLLPPR